MRLDHLLSKEHLAATSPVMGGGGCPGPLSLPNEWGTVLEGGTSTVAGLRAGGDLVRQAVAPSGVVVLGGNGSLLGRGRLGTLLGPEGTAVKVVRSGSLRTRSAPEGVGWVRVAAGWYRSDEPPTARTWEQGWCGG